MVMIARLLAMSLRYGAGPRKRNEQSKPPVSLALVPYVLLLPLQSFGVTMG